MVKQILASAMVIAILVFAGCREEPQQGDPNQALGFEQEITSSDIEHVPLEPFNYYTNYPVGHQFVIQDFTGQATISLEDLQGNIVVLEWFNHECPFVRYHYEQADTMTDLADKYADQDVVWLAVNSTRGIDTEAVLEYAEQNDIDYPILDDRNGEVGRAYGATRTPQMFIIEQQGRIVYEGAIDNAPNGNVPEGEEYINYVDQALTELLAGDEISIQQTEPYGCTVKY